MLPDETYNDDGSPETEESVRLTETPKLHHAPKGLRIPKDEKLLAIDCEMVGIGPKGRKSALARVSIVDYHGVAVYDKYVSCRKPITDYRTHVSGITALDLLDAAMDFRTVRTEVKRIVNNRILIGHSIYSDFMVLKYFHPGHLVRDSTEFPLFTNIAQKGHSPSLKQLASEFLGISIQNGNHDSVEDARTVMQLYRRYKVEWEESFNERRDEILTKYKPPKCFACGSTEHMLFECPTRPPKCFACESTEHMVFECPVRRHQQKQMTTSADEQQIYSTYTFQHANVFFDTDILSSDKPLCLECGMDTHSVAECPIVQRYCMTQE